MVGRKGEDELADWGARRGVVTLAKASEGQVVQVEKSVLRSHTTRLCIARAGPVISGFGRSEAGRSTWRSIGLPPS